MQYDFIHKYILEKPSIHFQDKNDGIYYHLKEYLMAILFEKEAILYLKLRSDKIQSDFLIRQYSMIKKEVSDKIIWILFPLDGNLSRDVIQMIIDESYITTLKMFKRRIQKQILKDVNRRKDEADS